MDTNTRTHHYLEFKGVLAIKYTATIYNTVLLLLGLLAKIKCIYS